MEAWGGQGHGRRQFGPTCILGDARRNVRLGDESWADALDSLGDDVDGGIVPSARGAESSEVEDDDLDEYPDL